MTVEQLESRRHLSVTFKDGLLSIVGSRGHDVIVVRTFLVGQSRAIGAPHRSGFRLTINGKERELVVEDYVRLSVRGRAGDDVIDLREGPGGGILGDGGFDDIPQTVEGGDGDDSLIGSSTRDLMRGGAGNDTLRGLGGNDVLAGGAGDDELHGMGGNDLLFGQRGNDHSFGGSGGDDLYNFGGGADTLDGGRGADGADHDFNDVERNSERATGLLAGLPF